jgi:hypothetical protein
MSLFCTTVAGQTLRKSLTDDIDYQLRMDAPSWKASRYESGTATIKKSEVLSDGRIRLKGQFYVYITKIFAGRKAMNFTAYAEQVLDEATVNCLFWTQPYLGSVYTIGDCD